MTIQELVTWGLTAVVSIISILIGVIWNMQQTWLKDHEELLKKKSDKSELDKIEHNLQSEIDKLETRHSKEMDQMAQRVGEQIKTSETNILTQIQLMIQIIGRKE